FLIMGRKHRFLAALLFAALATLAPLYWLGHNWWIYSNPFEFYNGPYSAMSIYRRALAQNMAPYRGDHDWPAAALYYLAEVRFCAGGVLVAICIAGLAGFFLRLLFGPGLLTATPPLFYIWSMH